MKRPLSRQNITPIELLWAMAPTISWNQFITSKSKHSRNLGLGEKWYLLHTKKLWKIMTAWEIRHLALELYQVVRRNRIWTTRLLHRRLTKKIMTMRRKLHNSLNSPYKLTLNKDLLLGKEECMGQEKKRKLCTHELRKSGSIAV